MARLTKVQKAVMTQANALGANDYLRLPWLMMRTVRCLFKAGLISYHSERGTWIVVPAGREAADAHGREAGAVVIEFKA